MAGEQQRMHDEVRATLERDARIPHPELIVVAVDEIGTVELRGAVETFRQRVAAINDAGRVEGVLEVVDHLRIHRGQPADDELRATALRRLMDDPRLYAGQIHVHVAEGHVTLLGHVGREDQRGFATDDVADLDGVVAVNNLIEVW